MNHFTSGRPCASMAHGCDCAKRKISQAVHAWHARMQHICSSACAGAADSGQQGAVTKLVQSFLDMLLKGEAL